MLATYRQDDEAAKTSIVSRDRSWSLLLRLLINVSYLVYMRKTEIINVFSPYILFSPYNLFSPHSLFGCVDNFVP